MRREKIHEMSGNEQKIATNSMRRGNASSAHSYSHGVRRMAGSMAQRVSIAMRSTRRNRTMRELTPKWERGFRLALIRAISAANSASVVRPTRAEGMGAGVMLKWELPLVRTGSTQKCYVARGYPDDSEEREPPMTSAVVT